MALIAFGREIVHPNRERVASDDFVVRSSAAVCIAPHDLEAHEIRSARPSACTATSQSCHLGLEVFRISRIHRPYLGDGERHGWLADAGMAAIGTTAIPMPVYRLVRDLRIFE